jgi:hypothetical protein
MRGRKPAAESRGSEIRARLAEWMRKPEFSRPSQRALAREFRTSHQILSFYLKNLHKWQSKEYWRQAKEIRARANAEDRALTQQEAQQVYAYNRAGIRVTVGPMLLDAIEGMRVESESRPLVWQEIKSLKFLAPGFPQARELLQKCSQNSVNDQKNNLPASASRAAKPFRRAKRCVATLLKLRTEEARG